MELKSLLVDSKTAWVDFPGLENFEVELANLSRKELISLRKRCTTNKFDRKSCCSLACIKWSLKWSVYNLITSSLSFFLIKPLST